MLRLCMATALILATGAATATPGRSDQREDAKLTKALKGMTPGAPLKCLRPEKFNEVRTFAATILYVGGRNKLYRNEVVGTCAGLARGDIPVTTSSTGLLCDGDIVQTRARIGGMLTGSCSLGKFVPYTR